MAAYTKLRQDGLVYGEMSGQVGPSTSFELTDNAMMQHVQKQRLAIFSECLTT